MDGGQNVVKLVDLMQFGRKVCNITSTIWKKTRRRWGRNASEILVFTWLPYAMSHAIPSLADGWLGRTSGKLGFRVQKGCLSSDTPSNTTMIMSPVGVSLCVFLLSSLSTSRIFMVVLSEADIPRLPLFYP